MYKYKKQLYNNLYTNIEVYEEFIMSIMMSPDEYIIVDSKGYIELTDKGLKVATTIYDRHDTLSSFFESIGVSHDTAVNDACRIEHVISDETMNKIKEHMKK